MSSKHTPGPWGIERYHGDINVISCNERDAEEKEAGIVYVIASDVGGMVHGENFDDYSEVEANARLIAAAPDLLEALEMLETTCELGLGYDHAIRQVARAAIAKAKGE